MSGTARRHLTALLVGMATAPLGTACSEGLDGRAADNIEDAGDRIELRAERAGQTVDRAGDRAEHSVAAAERE